MTHADVSLETCVQNVLEGSDLLCKTLFLAEGPTSLQLGKDMKLKKKTTTKKLGPDVCHWNKDIKLAMTFSSFIL